MTTSSPPITIRNLSQTDFDDAVRLVDHWWRDLGVSVVHLVHPVYYYQLGDTAFAAAVGNELTGILLGFVSQREPHEGYIHLITVAPEWRRHGIARRLYLRFFQEVRRRGCEWVVCLVNSNNPRSLAFHRSLGFEAIPGNAVIDGEPVIVGYGGPGYDRVVMRRALGPADAEAGNGDGV